MLARRSRLRAAAGSLIETHGARGALLAAIKGHLEEDKCSTNPLPFKPEALAHSILIDQRAAMGIWEVDVEAAAGAIRLAQELARTERERLTSQGRLPAKTPPPPRLRHAEQQDMEADLITVFRDFSPAKGSSRDCSDEMASGVMSVAVRYVDSVSHSNMLMALDTAVEQGRGLLADDLKEALLTIVSIGKGDEAEEALVTELLSPPPLLTPAKSFSPNPLRELAPRPDLRRNELLFRAASKGHWRIVKLLLSHPDAPQADCRDGELLVLAAASGDVHCVHMLLKWPGGNAPLADCQNGKPLIRAVEMGRMEVVKLFLNWQQPSTSLSSPGCFSGFLLEMALESDYDDILEALLETTASNLHFPAKNGWLAKLRGVRAAGQKLLGRPDHFFESTQFARQLVCRTLFQAINKRKERVYFKLCSMLRGAMSAEDIISAWHKEVRTWGILVLLCQKVRTWGILVLQCQKIAIRPSMHNPQFQLRSVGNIMSCLSILCSGLRRHSA